MDNHSAWNLEAYDRRHPEAKHAPNIHEMCLAGLVFTEGDELGLYIETPQVKETL